MEQKYLQEKDLGPMKLIFNYENIFYSFFYDDVGACVHRSREYAINYVYSGEMVLDNGEEQIHVGKGECVFIPRDHHITLYKKPCNGERYCGIFLSFTRNFLREMYAQGGPYKVPAHTPKLDPAVIKLPKTAEFTSLFSSLLPFFDPEVKPQGDFMHLKMQEGLLALLHIYMYEFTQEDLAHYTGRSLATFKRDFKKISDLTPEKWLIRKRLEVAYSLMKEGGRKIADVYAQVGFKNQSHFSAAFKRQYGVSPTAVMAS